MFDYLIIKLQAYFFIIHNRYLFKVYNMGYVFC